uniref:Uncharacterized protein n=1 Tax=Eutreptiella gymnastica TaxID=73025 RepID=A0A7S4CCQ1_9EUGL
MAAHTDPVPHDPAPLRLYNQLTSTSSYIRDRKSRGQKNDGSTGSWCLDEAVRNGEGVSSSRPLPDGSARTKSWGNSGPRSSDAPLSAHSSRAHERYGAWGTEGRPCGTAQRTAEQRKQHLQPATHAKQHQLLRYEAVHFPHFCQSGSPSNTDLRD